MNQDVYIGLGSNLESPTTQIKQATRAIANLPQTKLINCSSLYQSEPMGPQDQNQYINAVVKISTGLAPLRLLDELQAIEKQQGRVRKFERWGPRTLDLDLLLYAEQTIQCERLTVPHYGMKERAFVILPLLEIEPNIQLPDGSLAAEIKTTLSLAGIHKL